jgi:peroxiredoxin family protein
MADTTKKTIIVFSGDLDRAIAAFIIANGAAAMGDEVTMFFTFWGLSLLRKPKAPKHKKSFLQGMFGAMMPRGSEQLALSKMNFAGMGPRMMRRVMRQQNVMSLEELIASANEQGVKMIACKMSMDFLGFREDELVDGLDFVGVATYLSEADEANVNLFI